MSPGFIGVNAGRWATPGEEPASEVELYFFARDQPSQLYVGKKTGIEARHLLVGEILQLASFNGRDAIVLWSENPGDEPTYTRSTSADGGQTVTAVNYPYTTGDGEVFGWTYGAFMSDEDTYWNIRPSSVATGGGVWRADGSGLYHRVVSGTGLFSFLVMESIIYTLAQRTVIDPDTAVSTTTVHLEQAPSAGGGDLSGIASWPYPTSAFLIGRAGNSAMMIRAPDPGTNPELEVVVPGGTNPTTGLGLIVDIGRVVDNRAGTALVVVRTSAGDSLTIYKSTDDGVSWDAVHTWAGGVALGGGIGMPPLAFSPGPVAAWWVAWADDGAGGQGWWRSEDDGTTWTLVPSAGGEAARRFDTVGAGLPSIVIV